MIDDKVRKKIPNPKTEKRVIRVLSREQFGRLMVASDREPTRSLQLRDKALLYVLLSTGIRASELCGLTRSDLFLADDYLIVHRKGTKQREVSPLGAVCQRHLGRYLCGQQREIVFLSHRTGGALTPFGLNQLLKRLRDHAGDELFTGIRVSAHTFRHTFAVNFLKQGGNIKQLQLRLGHSSLAVT